MGKRPSFSSPDGMALGWCWVGINSQGYKDSTRSDPGRWTGIAPFFMAAGILNAASCLVDIRSAIGSECPPCGLVGRIEAFESQLGQGHVGGAPEDGRR